MEKKGLFNLEVTLQIFANEYKTYDYFVSKKQFEDFKTMFNNPQEAISACLEHSKGSCVFAKKKISHFQIYEIDSKRLLEDMINHYPDLALEIAIRETCLQHIRPFVQDLRYESKLLEERVKEHIGRISFPPHDPKIPNLDELRDRIAEESSKKGSMEKYDPKDDRLLTKPHCCVQAHGLMREATPEERLAAIKKAS